MKKYLEFTEGTSNKFWCVETDDNRMTITYGKIGTAGKSDTKHLASAEAADKEAIKQAAGKTKKGYIEKEMPEKSAATPPPSLASEVKKQAAVKAVKEPAKPKRPADVADDGKLKAWHDSDYWDACFWDAETYQNLDKPLDEDASSLKSKSKTSDSSDDTDVESCKEDFLYACREAYLSSYDKHIEKLRSLLSPTAFEKILKEGMVEVHSARRRCYVELKHLNIVEKLLAEGIDLPSKKERKSEMLSEIAETYLAAQGTKTYSEAIDEYYISVYKDVAEVAAGLFRTTLANLSAGQYNDKDGIEGNKLETDRLGFYIAANNKIKIHLDGGLTNYQENIMLENAEYDKIDLSDFDSDIEKKYLAICMRPLVEQMADEGLFNDITSLGYITVRARYSKPFFGKVVSETAQVKTKKELDSKLEYLETTEDWASANDILHATIKLYLTCGFDPDGLRCLNIMHRFIYCPHAEASDTAKSCLEACEKISEKFHVPYTFEWAMIWYNEFNWDWYCRDLEKIKDEYEPARKLLEEWEEEKKHLTYDKETKGIKKGSSNEENTDDEDKPAGTYTDEDLFCETDTMIALADSSGGINIRFKVEGLQGYTDVLNYLNNLMEKGYSKANDGYEMGVYFAAKPEFPPVKFHDYMPRVPEMALFHKALMYEELHEKVRNFVNLTVKEYDHYHDLDGEYSTVCGTFAAISAAMYDVKFMDLALRFAAETDGEHEKIAYYFADDLKKRYGVTQDTVAAIYELGTTCGHETKSCKELYTIPENVEAFMQHYSENYNNRFSKSSLCRFLGTIAGSSKGVLKKLKEYFDGASDNHTKSIYADFYNLALELLSEEDNKDYGEPVSAAPSTASNTSIEIEQFEESMPVIISADEASKRSGKPKSGLSFTEGRAIFVFRPSAITNPHIYHFVRQNRLAIGNLQDICRSFTCHSNNVLEILGKKYAFDLKGAAFQHGMIIYDGKNTPVVLYGVLDYANILKKFGKKSTTDRHFLEQLRVENLKMESPKGSPIPEWFDYNDDEEDDYMAAADENLYHSRYLLVQTILKKITKEHPHYPASLLLWAELMKEREDTPALIRIYTELIDLVPEHQEYWTDLLNRLKHS